MKQSWKVSTFYRESWKLTKSHPELWVLGILAVAFSQGGGSNLDIGNQLSGSDSSDKESDETTADTELTEEESTQMNQIGENLGEVALTVVDRTPVQVWGLLGLEVFVFFVFALVWGIMASVWIQASLMLGVQKARVQKKVSLPEVVQTAISRIRPLIWLSIVPMLAIFAGLIAFSIVGIVLAEIMGAIAVIYFLVGAGCMLFYAFRVSTALHWAVRYCVLAKMSGQEALRAGWKVSKGNIQRTIGLGLANWLVGGLVSFVIFLPALSISVALVVRMVMAETFEWWTLFPIVGSFLVTLPISAAFQTLWCVFTTSTWQLGFESVQSETETT